MLSKGLKSGMNPSSNASPTGLLSALTSIQKKLEEQEAEKKKNNNLLKKFEFAMK